jgi:uncharacterized protein
MDHPLQVSLGLLREKGRKKLEATVPLDAFGSLGEARLVGPVAVEIDAQWNEGRVLLSGKAAGDWETECCRCLVRTRSSYSAMIDVALEEPRDPIDALEEVRQTLVLSVPTQPYCRPDCRGLCPQCGADLNVKPCGCVVTPPSRFKITKSKRGKTDA